jgi:hypothetical protein
MKEITIKRVKSTINVLKHLVHDCPDATELLEEQIANLEQVIAFIELWIGVFYKNVPEPRLKFDLRPQIKGVQQADCADLPIESGSLQSIVFDLPFMFGTHGQTKNNKMNKRFTMFDSFPELCAMYQNSLEEFHRVLNKKGILIFKCQDYTDSKTTMAHCLVWQWALKFGFYAKDLFILTAKGGRIYNPNLKQKHARKFHSYLFVFEKR